MSGIFRTIFGGPSQSKQQSTSTGSSTSSSGNLAYPTIAGALTPATNYVSAGGNMLGALLGIPGYAPQKAAGSGVPIVNDSSTPAPTSTAQAAQTAQSILPNYQNGNQAFQDFTGTLDRSHEGDGQQDFYNGRGGDGGALANFFSRRITDVNQGRSSPNILNGGPAPSAPSSPSGSAPTPAPTAQANPYDALSSWADSAGMQFMRDNGIKAIEGSQAGKGMLQSGATGKALERFGQNLAQTYLNQYMQNVLGFANLGNNSAENLIKSGMVSSSSSTSNGQSSGKSEGEKQGIAQMLAQAIAAGA
jgi:hypothetical protein